MNLLDRFFPVPDYLRMPAVGLDISDQTIKYAEIKQLPDRIVLRELGVIAVASGAIERGEIQDNNTVVAVLEKIRTTLNVQFVNVALPEERVWLFNLSIPKVAADEIRDAILFRIEEHVPLEKKDTIFDFEIITQDKFTMMLQVHAVSRQLVETYRTLLEAAGFYPRAFELEAQSTVRAIEREQNTNPYLLVDFGGMRTTVSVVVSGVVVQTSTLKLSGQSITIAIQEALNIDVDKAEAIKQSTGMLPISDTADPILVSAQEVIRNALQIIIPTIQQQVTVWQRASTETLPPVNRIMICGGGSRMPGLIQYLEESLGMVVEPASVVEVPVRKNPRAQKTLDLDDRLAYATAIGLALPPGVSYD